MHTHEKIFHFIHDMTKYPRHLFYNDSRGDFVEKLIVHTKQEGRVVTSVQSVYIGLFAMVIGSVDISLSYAFAFIFVAYFYMRDRMECNLALAGVLLGSLCCGFFHTYLYALGFTLLFLSIHVLRLLDKNIYRSIPYLCAVLTIPYSLYAYGLSLYGAIIALATFALLYADLQDVTWIQKRLILTSTMYAIIWISFTFAFLLMAPTTWRMMILCGGLLITAFFCESKTMLLISLLIYLIAPEYLGDGSILILANTISLFKRDRILLVLSIMVFALWLKPNLSMSILLSFCGVLSLLYKESLLPFHMEKVKVKEEVISPQSLLKRQLQNFSNIFASLSDYYENISDVESQMLADMAKALKYSADTLRKVDIQTSQKQRILRAMEGYQYDVLNFTMQEPQEGHLAIEMDIQNIRKTEIKQTLLPLLEVLTHEHLKVTEVKHHRFTSGYHHITMENHVPFIIDAYADSQKNMFESSGDSFSIFRFRNSMICMISDGMGSGEKAATSSSLITNIFQRMVISGISKTDSIKCINKLLQSDAYATLDVICFDCSEGKAYIFKSAACPTFLIREGKLYEVNGSSLPVGIISSIEPDCFVADMQEGDEYLMVSDGIFMDEIYEWLRVRKSDSAKKSMEALMQIIKKKQRLDDSTAVLSVIHKVKM